MSTFFVSLIWSFGRSDNDMILWRNAYFQYMHTWFHVLSNQKILKGIYYRCSDLPMNHFQRTSVWETSCFFGPIRVAHTVPLDWKNAKAAEINEEALKFRCLVENLALNNYCVFFSTFKPSYWYFQINCHVKYVLACWINLK